MKHGPLALVDETMPLIVIATKDSSYHKQAGAVAVCSCVPSHSPRSIWVYRGDALLQSEWVADWSRYRLY
jgi:hypothetical protein